MGHLGVSYYSCSCPQLVSMRSVLRRDGFSMHPFCTLSLLHCLLLALALWHFPTVYCMIVYVCVKLGMNLDWML